MKIKKLSSLLLALLLVVSLVVPASAQQPSPFSDLSSSHWAFAAAQKAFSDQVVNGTYYNEATGERHFSPRTTVNIAQFITVVTRACFPYDVQSAANTDPWYAPGMEVAEKYDLLDGCGDVSVNDTASRYLMSVILYNVMDQKRASLPGDSDLAKMSERIGDWSSIPEEYETPVAAVFHLGIIQGVDDRGTFNGNANITREQLVVIYCRLMEHMDPRFDINDVDLPEVPSSSQGYGPTDTFILNVNSMKFHHPNCPSVKKMSEYNKQEFVGSREELIEKGYTPCKNCLGK